MSNTYLNSACPLKIARHEVFPNPVLVSLHTFVLTHHKTLLTSILERNTCPWMCGFKSWCFYTQWEPHLMKLISLKIYTIQENSTLKTEHFTQPITITNLLSYRIKRNSTCLKYCTPLCRLINWDHSHDTIWNLGKNLNPTLIFRLMARTIFTLGESLDPIETLLMATKN